MLEITILILTAVLNLLLGLIVYLKNPKANLNQYFFLLTWTLVIWSTANYISVHPVIFSQLTWIRFVLCCGALLNFAVFLSFLTFPANSIKDKYRSTVKWLTYATAFIMFLTLTPLVFKDLQIVNGNAQPVPNVGIVLFLLHTLALLGASLATIIKRFRHSTGSIKNQLRLVLFGITGTFSLIIFSNFLLVILFNNTALVPFGPAFTLIFSGSFAYAIIKHGLFDIRATVARSVAYLFSLGFIGLMYGATLFTLSSILSTAEQYESLQRAFYVGLALITALIYPYTKRFFDKLTNNLFYRDAYDPQQLLDQLNRSLVTQVDLEPLLEGVAQKIEASIKAEYCSFVIRETSYFPERIIGSKLKVFSNDEIKLLHSITPQIHAQVIVTELLDDEHMKLRRLLEKYNIEVLARLVTTVKYEVEGIGYLMLGPKKSGNLYTSQDENTLRIIANELVIAIQNALRFEEIENFNITLQKKVDEATRQMRRTNEKLKAMDETKDEFISMASHQLRTPLTSVKGYLSMVLEGDAGQVNEMQHKLLDQAYTSSQRMVYLIADLLNVSRLRTGKFVIEPSPTNLAELVEGEISQLKGTAKARNIKFSYQKPANFPTLMLDETKIRQVVMNFADNAIYYTPSGGRIDIELEDKPKTVEFRVVDNGLGVPKAEQHHLFTKFYRAENARKARPDGTGLGLFMAKKVIIAQGGSLIFKSAQGQGSTFGFSFDKSKLQPPDHKV